MPHSRRLNWVAIVIAGVVLEGVPVRSQTPMPPNSIIQPLPLLNQNPSALSGTAAPRATLGQPILAPNPNQYALGAGDQIQITVANYDEVSGQRTVMPDGTITLPLIGSITVAGLTTEELTKQLQVRWNRFLINPVVTTNLTGLRPVMVSVSGEVQRPGPRKFNATDGNANLMSAVASAGGITRNADISKVMVKRRTPGGVISTLTFNLWDVVNENQIAEDLALQDGDAISIPRLEAGTALDRRLIARSSLAANTVRVRVVGEVKQPGEVQVPPDGSLSSAIAISGGPTNDAKLNEVVFIRMNNKGEAERQTLNLNNLSDTIQVQEGDVLMVPKKPLAKTLDTVGRAFGPLNFLLRLFTGF
jgi:polysaccharide export outer membrane protein